MENAVPIGPVPNRHANYCGSCSGQTNGFPVNYFPDGVAQANNWRNPILGIDTRDGGAGILGGLAYWNMDFSIKKSIRVAESVSLEFQGVFANLLNHNQWTDNYLCLCNNGGFGALGYNTAANNGIGVDMARQSRETSNWAFAFASNY